MPECRRCHWQEKRSAALQGNGWVEGMPGNRENVGREGANWLEQDLGIEELGVVRRVGAFTVHMGVSSN